MKTRKIRILAFAFVAVIVAVAFGFSASSHPSIPVRSFEFTYLTKIPSLPADAKNPRIWIPLPPTNAYQTISDLKIESSLPYTTHRDSEYGNEYVYLQFPAAKASGPTEVRVTFQAKRQEHRVALGSRTTNTKRGGAPPETPASLS